MTPNHAIAIPLYPQVDFVASIELDDDQELKAELDLII